MRVSGWKRISAIVTVGAAGWLAAGVSPAAGTPAVGGPAADGTCLGKAVTVAGDTATIDVHPGGVVSVAHDGQAHDVVWTYDPANDDLTKSITVCGNGANTALRYDAALSGVSVHFPRIRDGFVSHAPVRVGRRKIGAVMDTFTGVGTVAGSQCNDSMLGNDDDNVMIGNGGDDHLIGFGGNDTLISGSIRHTADPAADLAAARGSQREQADGGHGTDVCITADRKPGSCESAVSPLVG